MTVFTGHTGNAGHFLQPTASAMGHRTTPFSEGLKQVAYALSRVALRAYSLKHLIAGVHVAAVLGRRFAGSMRLARLAETLQAINWLQTVGSLEWEHPPWILWRKRADLIQSPKLVLGESEF